VIGHAHDRPGALARVAAVIAGHGGNVVGIDVQEVDAESAVDELVIDVPDDVAANATRRGRPPATSGD